MDTLNSTPNDGNDPAREGTVAGRRLPWEAEKIAEARAEPDTGLYIDSSDVDAWIDSIGTDHELPLPPARHWLT